MTSSENTVETNQYRHGYGLAPEGYEWVTINATQIQEGDLYNASGYSFMATDIKHDQPGNHADTKRSTWQAVWTGVGSDPHPGWHRFGSAGNELHTMTVLRRKARTDLFVTRGLFAK